MSVIRQLILTALLLFISLTAFAVAPVSILGLQFQPGANETRITFTLSEKTSGTVKFLPAPNRVIVEFANTTKKFNIQHAKLGGANVQMIDTESAPKHVLRFIFYVNGSVKWTTNFLPDTSNGVQLQLDIKTVKSPASPTSMRKLPRAAIVMNGIDHALTHPALFTVVVDAGHGGKDPGARGMLGTEEKKVVLSMAIQLAKEINQLPNMRAVLTRSGDYFVPLAERLRLARKDKADLFIAIHADAYYDNTAHGASVYALSEHGATSVAARWLAERENHSELGGVELNALQDRSPMLRSVLIDLAQTATSQDSIRLGNKVLDALEDVSVLHYSQVEQAPFMVLKSPDIPSILVETGFISNRDEERQLADHHYQKKIAHALCEGVKKYVKKYALARM